MVLLFGIMLQSRSAIRDMETKFFWVPVMSSMILAFQDVLESYCAVDPGLRMWRIYFSVLGYSFRSFAAVGMLMVVVPAEKRKPVLWVPCIVNMLVCCTAFFSGLCFGYDEQYAFYRGPLGMLPFIVPAVYLVMILMYTVRAFTVRNSMERVIPPLCVLFCMVSVLADTVFGGTRINEAMLISCIFFYIFLHSHDNRRDPLTGLLNRKAYYDDCKQYRRSIGAVASLDMNGLKELNDTQGHQAGDKALLTIGKCLNAAVDQNTQAYRIGGDEFLLLFFHDSEARVTETEQRIRESVAAEGYHVSVGHAMCGQLNDLESAVSVADERMYADKARYYQESGKNRRKR